MLKRPIDEVTLHLAGNFLLVVAEQPVHRFHSIKTQALLAYLVLEHDHPLSREQLAGILWEGYARRSARASLRLTLSDLRSVLQPFDDLIVATRNTVLLCHNHPAFWCGVLQLRRTLRAIVPPSDTIMQSKTHRQLLAGMERIEGERFQSWLEVQRESYQALLSVVT